jgi:amino acid adenylation domain-containing protein
MSTALSTLLAQQPQKEKRIKKYVPIPCLIKNTVEQYAKNTAIVDQEIAYNYLELWQHVLLMKNYLLKQGIKPGQRLIVYGYSSFQFVACLIAVWLCRGIIVPIDNSIPTARIESIANKAGVTTLIYISKIFDQKISINKIINLSDLTLKAYRTINTRCLDVQPEDAAYIFSTSGTTGEPKLILGNHNGLSHFLNWQQKQFSIGQNDTCILTTPVTFDVMLRDIFLALISGAKLIIPKTHYESVLSYIEQYSATYLHTTPSKLLIWSLWNEDIKPKLTSLKWIFSAGEKLTTDVICSWRKLGFQGKFVNLYGPTETTLAKCFQVIDEPFSTHIQPVGKPLPNTQIYIVDKRGNPCAEGEPGEIAIKTYYSTHGYIKPSPQEATRFFYFNYKLNHCLYYTGDKGYIDKTGLLHVLGRLDEEIKLRGVKINLNEIESLLLSYPKIHFAKVLLVNSAQEQQHLIAFYLTIDKEVLDESAIVAFLSNYLPKIMIPYCFFSLKSLPLTKNGKTDKISLLNFYHQSAKVENEDRSSFISIAKSIVGHSLKSNHNLFDQGFDSLLAMAFIAKINQHYKISLQFAELVKYPSIRELEIYLKNRPTSTINNVINFNTHNQVAIFAFPPISGWGIIYKALAEELSNYAAVYAFDFLDEEKRIEKYSKYILNTCSSHQSYYLLGYSAGGNLAYEVAKQIENFGYSINKLILLDAPPKMATTFSTNEELQQFSEKFFGFLEKIGFVAEISANKNYNTIAAQIKQRLFSYRKFLNELANQDNINAEIALITCAENPEITEHDIHTWQLLTQKKISIYQGYGDHFSMLDKKYATDNAKLLQKIFQSQ